jgi:hypothetical protein
MKDRNAQFIVSRASQSVEAMVVEIDLFSVRIRHGTSDAEVFEAATGNEKFGRCFQVFVPAACSAARGSDGSDFFPCRDDLRACIKYINQPLKPEPFVGEHVERFCAGRVGASDRRPGSIGQEIDADRISRKEIGNEPRAEDGIQIVGLREAHVQEALAYGAPEGTLAIRILPAA